LEPKKNNKSLEDFDPSGVLVKNGNIFGLPFSYESAKVVIIPVTWDVTVSNLAGTSNGPKAILDYSTQIDYFDFDVEDAYKLGIYLLPFEDEWQKNNEQFRPMASEYINFLENGGNPETDKKFAHILSKINKACLALKYNIYDKSIQLLEDKKLPIVLGGEHSCPLGLLEALSEKYEDFGILQIDAHADLRAAYEGFTYSHASIFYNALKNCENISKLISVGVRDVCQDEIDFINQNKKRIKAYFDNDLSNEIYSGNSNWKSICKDIVNQLPKHVYVSFDIDGLSPHLCPATGTPVPGGLEFNQANMLLKELILQNKTIIGADLSEVSVGKYPIENMNSEINANVGSRILFKLCNLMGRSNQLI